MEIELEAWALEVESHGNPGPTSYRCVDLTTNEEVFRFGEFYATRYIGAFLSIVHALALMDQRGMQRRVVYSDCEKAVRWVWSGELKTTLALNDDTAQTHALIARANKWLEGRVATKKWARKKPDKQERLKPLGRILVWHKSLYGPIPRPEVESELKPLVIRTKEERERDEASLQTPQKMGLIDERQLNLMLNRRKKKVSEHTILGRWGEEYAAEYLRDNGYLIRHRDWHLGKKDLDIVAYSPSRQEIVFVEVKTRSSDRFLDPITAVNNEKRTNIALAANAYLKQFNIFQPARFDIITIVGTCPEDAKLKHIENAFSLFTIKPYRKKRRW